MSRALIPFLLLLAACPPPPLPPAGTPVDTDVVDTDVDTEPEPPPALVTKTVRVTLDGTPTAGIVVSQGGVDLLHRTDDDGEVVLSVDRTLDGEHVLIASHPEARMGWVQVRDNSPDLLDIDLVRYDPADNLEYAFQDPGTPDRRDTTNQCAHCHKTLNDDWWASPHRTSASNAHVHDLYAGTSAALGTESACQDAGGTWALGLEPGTGNPASRCYLGTGVLPELDPSCAPNCEGRTEVTAGCADCHAPGIDGELGGRGLHEATGLAYEAGVHCDVCHKVDTVAPEDPRPGVAGKLVVHRPSEVDETGLAGKWTPVQFGPHHDVPNPRMGSIQRDHYKTGQICIGCHEYAQEVVLPGAALDVSRWPEERLPVHTTWTEWQRGPFGGEVPCNACHMPPAPDQLNSANLQDLLETVDPGVAGGWARPAGAIRHHSWIGPRADGSRMLELAGALDVGVETADEVLTVSVRTSNVGAGHRMPTGEPGRQLVLHVAAACDDVPLDAIGGDAIPLWVGTEARRGPGEDWLEWPQAQVGDVLRLVRRSGWREDPGFGPFGDGTFSGEAAGNARTEVLALRRIVAVEEGSVSLDAPWPDEPPEDAEVWRGPALGVSAGDAGAVAGAPGHAFARVMQDPDGRLAVPHHRAVDVVLDNRLGPHEFVDTEHRFRVSCEAPSVTASLTWRAHPVWLASEKRWSNAEKLMVEVKR